MTVPRVAIATILAFASLAPPAQATELLRVIPASKAEFLRLQQVAPEINACGVTVTGETVEFAAAAGRAADLVAQGFSVEIAVPDLESFYASRLGGGGDFGAFHTYTEAIQDMDALAAAYPLLMAPKQSIGTSIEGRTLWVYKISDNPGVDEDEPEVFFNAYIHAREPISFEVIYGLADYLLGGYGSDSRATAIVNTREVWLLPVVNPDGVEYNRVTDPNGGGMWRKNRRLNPDFSFGVDLNRNFGYNWGFDDIGSSPDPTSETYRGTGPFSEPEVQAVRGFVNSRQFGAAVYYHSYGRLHIFPWGYDDLHPPDYDAILALGGQCRIGSGYNVGSGWELLYFTNGGAYDWMYGETVEKPSIPAFTTEVGSGTDGFWPLESNIPTLVSENLEGNLRLCELADNPYRALPPHIAEIDSPDTVGTSFTLAWSVPDPDPDNPAATWNLVEATGHTVGMNNLEGANQLQWNADGWAWSTARSHSSSHSFYSGNTDNLNNLLTSRRARRVQPGEQLKFWTWYRIENGLDYGYVEVSTDNRSFTSLPGTITTNSDPNGRNLGNGITGNAAAWAQATFSLSAYAGQVIWLRFRYNTDRFNTSEGWYVDDIEPADLFATEVTVANDLPVSEFEFTDHPEGAYSYLVQSVDGEGQSAPWSPPITVVVSSVVSVADASPSGVPWRGLELAGANPFGGEARLRFGLPAGARAGEPVRLTIHDVGGRTLATLLRSQVGANGIALEQTATADEGTDRSTSRSTGGSALSARGASIEVQWKPGTLPVGLYLARLSVGPWVSEEKLLRLE